MAVKLYYSDDYVTIYHGDCREHLNAVDGVDIVVTDPPYGMSYSSNHRPKHRQLGGIKGDQAFDSGVIAELVSMARSACYCFGRWDNLVNGDMSPRSAIVWDKGNHSMGDLNHEYGRKWEVCGFWPGRSHKWRNGRPVDIISVPRVPPADLVHPNEKPVELLEKIILHSAGNTVFDPYCGSGSTLRAAKNIGLKAVGVDLEEQHCETAAKRMAQECFQF